MIEEDKHKCTRILSPYLILICFFHFSNFFLSLLIFHYFVSGASSSEADGNRMTPVRDRARARSGMAALGDGLAFDRRSASSRTPSKASLKKRRQEELEYNMSQVQSALARGKGAGECTPRVSIFFLSVCLSVYPSVICWSAPLRSKK